MQVVCEATQSPYVPVQVGAFECLVRIMTLYYDKMAFYMERALFGVGSLVSKMPYIIYVYLSIVNRDGYETL
jgi:importin subunit beta-1